MLLWLYNVEASDEVECKNTVENTSAGDFPTQNVEPVEDEVTVNGQVE